VVVTSLPLRPLGAEEEAMAACWVGGAFAGGWWPWGARARREAGGGGS
jgi:hypothetical protein